MSNASRKNHFYLFFVFFSVAFALVIIIHFAIIMIGGESSQKKYSDPEVSTTGKRGVIYDRNGEILAISVPYIQCISNPRQISDSMEAAQKLSPILGLPVDSLVTLLSKDTGYSVLKRKMDLDQKETLTQAIKDAGLWGEIYLEEYQSRSYPTNFHAAQIIGFTDLDSVGLEGAELAFNNCLTPHPTLGREISYGDDVYLTIDIKLQYLCDSVLQEMCQTHDPDYAVLVLMDAGTGEILASSSYPWYNLNSYNQSTAEERQNKPFTYAYEPGSVFKIFSLATCLQADQADFETPYTCTGSHTFITASGQSLTINCHEAHGVLDYVGMIKASCNGAISNWALQTDDSVFYDGLRALNFGESYSFDYFNASGSLAAPATWSYRSKPTISFGQEMSATPLQLTTAATIFTNGGVLLQPRILLKTVDQFGETVTETARTEIRQVVSEDVARNVLEAMIEATKEGGTAIKTSVPGLEVAAKTGTAEILESKDQAVTASTLAIFPADEPEYIIYVAASNPKGSTIWGANIASPAIGSLIDSMVSAGKLKSREYSVIGESTE